MGFAFRMATHSAPSSSAPPYQRNASGSLACSTESSNSTAVVSGDGPHRQPSPDRPAVLGRRRHDGSPMLGGSTRDVAVSSRIDRRLRMPGDRDDRLFRRLERRSDPVCRERGADQGPRARPISPASPTSRTRSARRWPSCSDESPSRSGSRRARGLPTAGSTSANYLQEGEGDAKSTDLRADLTRADKSP